jgi:hypothetical protein
MSDITYEPPKNAWEQNRERIRQLWPTGMYPEHLGNLMRQRLSGLNQEWLTRAIEDVKCKFSSHQPELKWFLEAYERIEEKAWASQDRKRTPVEVIIVDHVRVRDGKTSQVSTVFTDRAEAEAFARQQNGTIRGQRKTVSDDELRAWLKSQSRAALQAAVDLVRRQGWGEWEVPGDLDRWGPMLLGAVAGGLDVIERRRAA